MSASGSITVVMGVRLHEQNPWVLPRLKLWANHYSPRPPVIIVDMGSEGLFADQLEAACRQCGLRRVVHPDEGVYSQSIARNVGAQAADTELLFFTDADCIGPSDFFTRLENQATAIDLHRGFDQLLTLPAYHLEAGASAQIEAAHTPIERSRLLERTFARSVYSARGTVAEYVDPFSNIFLCHRSFFSLAGGYDPTFRGHGSEDFEFMIRGALHSRQLLLPDSLDADERGPTTAGFWGLKAYEGFRRLGEATAIRAELAGLRVAHLHHVRSQGDAWYRRNDWSRERLSQRLRELQQGWTGLLRSDGLARPKDTLAVVREDWEASLLLPMRLDGHHLTVCVSDHHSGSDTLTRLEEERFGAVAHVQGHPAGPALAKRARALRKQVITVSPGQSDLEWRYGSGVSARFVGSRADGYRVVDHPGLPHEVTRARELDAMDPSSFAAARLGVAIRCDEAGRVGEFLPDGATRWIPSSVRAEPARRRLLRKARKMVTKPGQFVADSSNPALTWLRRWL